ncbi:MAG: IS3 family transposase, partial [Gammaproteobacteria bacterium]|nr:IS3 family transposase [Gammaproteobacteria bacterium]
MSPATRWPYPLTMVCETWRIARSSVYALRARLDGPPEPDRRQPGKRGPKTAQSDDELLAEIRMVLKASPFLGEGHRKVKARLAAKGIRVGKNRVLRLMRLHGLLAPVRRGHPRGDRTHSGRIQTERPDELWGTDASRFWTKAEGWCW